MTETQHPSDQIARVVSELLCIGCGLCSAVCREGAIVLDYPAVGLHQARVQEQCTSNCGRCAKVCPFSDQVPDESEIASEVFGAGPHSLELGVIRSCHVVRRPGDSRVDSASGGAVTWLLETLLEQGIIDRTACVASTGSQKPRFSYVTCSDSAAVTRCAGSSYAAVSVADVVRAMRDDGGSWAVVAVPCVAKGLRAVARIDSRVANSLTVLIGLTCGQTKTDRFPDWVRRTEGIAPGSNVRFRVKDSSRPADDFALTFDDDQSTRVHWRKTVAPVWHSRLFTPPACGICDDVFAETADVVAMDAWLPEFVSDWRGTSLVGVRSERVRVALDVMRDASDGGVLQCSPESIIKSQSGALWEKRDGLQYRLMLRQREGRWSPRKRLKPARTGSMFDRAVWRSEMWTSERSFTTIGSSFSSPDSIRLGERLVAQSVRLRARRGFAGSIRSKVGSVYRRIIGRRIARHDED